MSAIDIIRDVHVHGGKVTVDGNNLALIAPRPLPDELLHALRTHKANLLAYLKAARDDPAASCPTCGAGQWWQSQDGGAWHCRRCVPDMPLTAMTLTIRAGHVADATPIRDPARLQRLIEAACSGLSITPQQLRRELEAGGDMSNLVSSALSGRGLRLVAETLAVMRYPYPTRPREIVGKTVYGVQVSSESK